MKKKNDLQVLGEHVRHWWLGWTAVLGFTYLIYKVNSPIADLCREWLNRHAKVENGAIKFDGLPPAVLAAAVFLTVTLLGLCLFTIWMVIREKRKQGEDKGKRELLLNAFHHTTQSADLIAKKLFPGAALPIKIKKLVSCKHIYSIYENGDCHYQEELVLCAKDQPLHLWEKILEADPEGDSVEFPEQINLKIESMTENKLVSYLISKNEPRYKRVVVFFLPFIQPGVPEDQRKLKITFYWSGLMRRLLVRGEEEFESDIKSTDPVPSVEYQFWVKPNMGLFTCTHVGTSLEGGVERLTPTTNENGMQGWVYQGTNLPSDHITRLRLELKRN